MNYSNSGRRATTLIEVIVSIGIVAVLVGLLVPAIALARNSALQTTAHSNLKQMALATLQLAEAKGGILHDGKIPIPHVEILKYMGNDTAIYVPNPDNPAQPKRVLVMAYVNPNDPSFDAEKAKDPKGERGNCSFAFNRSFFPEGKAFRYPDSVGDGTANTLLFGEHYSHCKTEVPKKATFYWEFRFNLGQSTACPDRPVSFGDGRYGDLLHKAGKPFPDQTFQDRPALGACDPNLMQGAFGGLATASADGSVRQLAASIKPSVYWAAFTPDGKEKFDGW